ncbi:hypothetical protein KIPE111705_39575 [Kibdelosporangium persicum]|uniref:WXG100 family type VII secretion target n=1 Tax=Kibdelosporangium persicum TaxID=2698649 RepID=A0ABX2FDA2_9PSEU|nr:hypothetical protein [Kibdelosporangium persicum]NRN68745.1 hypothetical protein [Kibdelosporangium persicum]
MSGILGMEVERAREVATKIDSLAGKIMADFNAMNGEVQTGFEWKGTDSLRFRETWNSQVQKRFKEMEEMLKAEALYLRREAQQQADVSGGTTGAITPGMQP